MQALTYYLVRPLLWLLSLLPLWILYGISTGVSWILNHLVRYRRSTVHGNLKIAFPDKSDRWVKSTADKFYEHFTDTFIELLKSQTISEAAMRKRFTYTNPELLNHYTDQGIDVIMVFGHYASYEWSNSLQRHLTGQSLLVYKPLANHLFDNYIRSIRGKYGSHLVPMADLTSRMAQRDTPQTAYVVGLLCDQLPRRDRVRYFTKFFDTPTGAFMGPEVLAKKGKSAVIYMDIQRVKRGYYSASFELLTDTPRETDRYEITDMFFKRLEKQIEDAPAYYLWTHKRWKTTPDMLPTRPLSPQFQT